jgi:hypothetical protein
MIKRCAVFVLSALCAVNAHAIDSNEKLNYQGRLVSGTNLVNGIVTNVFRLYNSSGGSTILFTQTQTVTVVDGLYSTTIGSDSITPSLESALASPVVYIEVEVNGTILLPRERIVQAAYSLSDVDKTGDTMTGPLGINVGANNDLVITNTGDNVMIGNRAGATFTGVAIGTGTRSWNEGVSVGYQSTGGETGVAVGVSANGLGDGAAVGAGASGEYSGAAVGRDANGYWFGAAVGKLANGSQNGTALGASADGNNAGVGVGRNANGSSAGVAVGNTASGADLGIAIGNSACGAHTNIAIGYMAAAGFGPERIAIGHAVMTPQDNSAIVRGTLFLDGGSNVYFRTNFGSGAWTSLGGGETATGFVRKTGDTMTGRLTSPTNLSLRSEEFRVATLRGMVSIGGGDDVEIGAGANGYNQGAAVGGTANGYDYGAALGSGANGQNHGVAVGNNATGFSFGVSVGAESMATNRGTVVGEFSSASDYGAGVGYSANGNNYGAAVGQNAGGPNHGAALGNSASGNNYGTAIGEGAVGTDHGVAVGNLASGSGYGVAVGYNAYGYGHAVALGNTAKAYNSNIAIGVMAYAINDWNITAIGQYVTNNVANSARLRGTLYLDGATGILYRTTFGSGAWNPMGYNTNAVQKTGDTMVGALAINAPGGLVITSSSNSVAIGNAASAPDAEATAVGRSAAAYAQSAAIGANATAATGSVSVGYSADSSVGGVALGSSASAEQRGVAIGQQANGSSNSVAIGYNAKACPGGVSVGYQSDADPYGTALGSGTKATNSGIAIGYNAYGAQTNIAIGVQADAGIGGERIAIGHSISNTVNNSTALRGTLYLDGGTNVMIRSPFGTGAWSNLVYGVSGSFAVVTNVTQQKNAGTGNVTNVIVGTATWVFQNGLRVQ